MSCVIDEKTTTIVRKEGYWLIGGKLKVNDLSECTFLPSKSDRTITVGTKTENTASSTAPITPPQPKDPHMEQLTPRLDATTLVSTDDNLDMNLIKSIAGESVWGAVAIMALLLTAKFLNKYFDLQSNRSKSTEDLSKQCEARQVGNDEKAQELNKKLETVQSALAEAEKRLSGLELELKYMIDPPPRNRQNRDYFDDDHPPQTRHDGPPQTRFERQERIDRPDRVRPPKG
jgi:hypothetical protein